jgi:hypothetical protein
MEIETATEEETGSGVFAAALGAVWPTVDERLRRFHRAPRGEGVCRLEWGRGMGWLARGLRLPAPGESLPVRLTVRRGAGLEVWERRFGGDTLRSTQRAAGGLIAERYGAAEVLLRPAARDGALFLEATGAALCLGRARLPLPRWVGPGIEARDEPAADAETIHFAVRITLFGRDLLRYEGDLRVGEEGA